MPILPTNPITDKKQALTSVQLLLILLAILLFLILLFLPLLVVLAQGLANGITAFWQVITESDTLAAFKLTLIAVGVAAAFYVLFCGGGAWGIT